MTLRTTIFALTVGGLAVAAHAGEMKPGQWEYTMTTVVPGVPFSLPAITTPLCLSADDVKYGVSSSGAGHKGDCRYANLRHFGDTTRYDMVCPGHAGVKGRFEFTSTTDSVRGKGVIDTGQSKITQEWTGRRIGDC